MGMNVSTQGLSLYHYEGCPFCARVRSALENLGLDVELRDIELDADHRGALITATNRRTVPCLRIEDTSGEVSWMHESADIVNYLEKLTEA